MMNSAFSRAISALILAFLLMAGSRPARAGDPEPTYFQRRGTVIHVDGKGMMTIRAELPETLARKSMESVEKFFLSRAWVIRNDEGMTLGTYRCLRVQETDGGFQLSGLYSKTEEDLPRAGMEFGEFLKIERTDPPARVILRKKERPLKTRSEVDEKEMILVPEDYLVYGQGLDSGGDNFNPHFFERTPGSTPRIRSFYMDRTEVTNGEYYRFCRRTHRPLPPEWKGAIPTESWNEPFLYARFADAVAYAAWSKKRLPTEFEWELAARGGLRSRHDEDSFESSPPSYPAHSSDCNTIEAWEGKAPAPVSVAELKDATPSGIVGMCGNAPEWTSSFYVPYPGSTFRQANGKLKRVIRGGAFFLPLEQARAESRRGASPDSPVRAGFRLVMDVH